MTVCDHAGLMRMLMNIGQEAVLSRRLGSVDFVCPKCASKVQLEVFRRREGSEWVWGFRIYDLVPR